MFPFINPKTDFAFKKIFGSEQSKDILISFLNALLYDGHSIIQDLTILNPYQVPKILGVKESYLDVKAQLKNGSWVIIEMQVLNVAGFEKRVLYNATKTYSAQLKIDDQYSVLNPVIALTVTAFEMFKESDRPISRFVLKEKNSLVDYPISDLELVFIELPKFKTPLSNLETLTDKWIYFLQYAKDLSVVPETMGEIAAIRQAFDIANQAGLTPEELDKKLGSTARFWTDFDRSTLFFRNMPKISITGSNLKSTPKASFPPAQTPTHSKNVPSSHLSESASPAIAVTTV